MDAQARFPASLAALVLLPLLGCSAAAPPPSPAAQGVVITHDAKVALLGGGQELRVTAAYAANDGHGYVDATLGPTN